MRLFAVFLIDLALLLAATLCALLLRDNFESSVERLIISAPYFVATALASIVVIPVLGLNRAVWRMSSMPDYVRIVVGVVVIVIVALSLTFAFNRLYGVARSLPILQGMVAVGFLVGARVLMRLRYSQRQVRKASIAPLKVVVEAPVEIVLVVGMSRLTGAYLESIAELAPGRIEVVGLLGRSDRHVGRLVGNYKVLGLPDQVEDVVSDLEVHGIAIDRIVVTTLFQSLSPDARRALLAIERTGSIELQFLAERLGFEKNEHRTSHESNGSVADQGVRFEIASADIAAVGKRHFWKFKRFGDFWGAAVLLMVLMPAMLFVGVLVAVAIGFPITFWQQRPGLGGRPFKLYKFRTMGAAYKPDGRRISDEDRASSVGNFLRRTRLDELPQLFNILSGDMSFVGPRPLLPRDQADAYRARLLVRPGLTGWAQVVGGRDITAADKAALDVWYVKNAGPWFDLSIIARTIPMVIFGERTAEAKIKQAWFDLREAGILRGELASADGERKGLVG